MSAQDPTRPADGAARWMTPSGLVTVYAPAGKSPYYRIAWGTPRQDTSGGRTYLAAAKKAVGIETSLLEGATPKTKKKVEEGIAYWLDPERPTPRGGWGRSHRKSMTNYARDYFLPTFGSIPCQDLGRSHIAEAVNQARTESEARKVKSAASSLILALRQGDYLPDGREMHLRAVVWDGKRAQVVPQTQDEQTGFVPRGRRPSHAQVAALRSAAEKTGRVKASQWWRGLMVELAAYSGLRLGELLALTVDDISVAKRTIAVTKRVDEAGGKLALAAPKMDRTRVTIYPEQTPTGYELAACLNNRIIEVEREHSAGKNSGKLLFPSASGTLWSPSNFRSRVFVKAATMARWPNDGGRERWYGKKKRIEIRWYLVWHSLRHTFCTVALEEWGLTETEVAALAGHSDTATTRRYYIGASDEVIASAFAATALRK